LPCSFFKEPLPDFYCWRRRVVLGAAYWGTPWYQASPVAPAREAAMRVEYDDFVF